MQLASADRSELSYPGHVYIYIYIYWSQLDAQPCFTKFDRQLVLNNLFVYISTYNIYIFMYTEKSQQFLMVHRYRKQKIPPKIKIKGSSI